jgi:hypothetical protein
MIPKNKILIIFFFILFSCSSLKKAEIKGVYKYKSQISQGTLSISDSVFEYKYEAPLVNYSSKGTWSFSKNYLLLKSYDSYKSDYIEVKEKITEIGYIEVVDMNKDPISNVNITINGKSKYSTDDNGRVYLKSKENPKNIQINYIGLSEKNNSYPIKYDKSNTFVVVIFQKDDLKKYFNFDKIKINKGNVIIDKQIFIKKQVIIDTPPQLVRAEITTMASAMPLARTHNQKQTKHNYNLKKL